MISTACLSEKCCNRIRRESSPLSAPEKKGDWIMYSTCIWETNKKISQAILQPVCTQPVASHPELQRVCLGWRVCRPPWPPQRWRPSPSGWTWGWSGSRAAVGPEYTAAGTGPSLKTGSWHYYIQNTILMSKRFVLRMRLFGAPPASPIVKMAKLVNYRCWIFTTYGNYLTQV